MYKKQFFSSVYRLPLSECDGTELSPLGSLSPVCGMDKEQMHSGDKCLEVPSPHSKTSRSQECLCLHWKQNVNNNEKSSYRMPFLSSLLACQLPFTVLS